MKSSTSTVLLLVLALFGSCVQGRPGYEVDYYVGGLFADALGSKDYSFLLFSHRIIRNMLLTMESRITLQEMSNLNTKRGMGMLLKVVEGDLKFLRKTIHDFPRSILFS